MRKKALRQNADNLSETTKPLNVLSSVSASILNNLHSASNLITIAKIVRPQGIKGELIATIETDFPEHFEELDSVFLVFPNGKIQETTIEDFWFHKNRIVLKFPSIDTRTEAEHLRSVAVKIPPSELVKLPKDQYYEFDLVDCYVVTTEGTELGQVQELIRTGPAPILVVKGIKEYLIPFAEEICTTIDIKHKKIIIDPPAGLLEL